MNRPLSPHLQIYKPQLTSVMSILHRLTGVGVIKIMLYIVFFLYTLTAGEELYKQFCSFLKHPIVKMGLILAIACVYYHLLNGLRYLLWGIGLGLELKQVYLSGWIISLAVIALTTITWMLI
jgi:succinate dehydrogenase / fumarate reductase cytochrome b subunit